MAPFHTYLRHKASQNALLGVFSMVRHNELRDITASLMTKVCHGVSMEPTLQTLSVERLPVGSANTTDGARVYVHPSYCFWWDQKQRAFFDVYKGV